MVEILCPHCEGEIELDDDAKGEFACPLCDGEFEWGLDDGDDGFNFMAGEPSNSRDILREYSDNPVIRITAGSIFATMMGIYAAFVALPIIFGGLFVNSLEGAAGTGTGFGAIFILIGIAFLIFFVTGITFGVLMAKGKLSALIVCTVFSIIGLVGTIIGWLWFSAVKYYETKTKTYMTYFNESPDNNRCNLTNNVYKCNVTNKL